MNYETPRSGEWFENHKYFMFDGGFFTLISTPAESRYSFEKVEHYFKDKKDIALTKGTPTVL